MMTNTRRAGPVGPAITIALAMVAASLSAQNTGPTMDVYAPRYIRLVLELGQHDADFVDAYYGPPELKTLADAARPPLPEIDAKAAALVAEIERNIPPPPDELTGLRRQYVLRQLASLRSRIAILSGRKMSFDEESLALYDAVAPTHTGAEFESVLAELDTRLPGSGSLLQRYDAFRARFVIPRERLDATFKAAIEGCRSRTLQYVQLPASENFTVEYVTNKSWSGYNWYQGNYRSLIQVNTDLPVYADRAIDLACHEGYPGHHVYNVLLEKNLVRDRGWLEFSVYPLFSPQSLIAEGTANYGIDVAFPRAERLEFERRVIFPAAGLDPATAASYYEVLALTERLSYAGNEAARRYLNGQIDARAAADWLERYGLYTRARAEQRVRFIDQYRSYVINYNLGKDLVARYIEAQGGTAANPAARWQAFERLISSPRLPSGLR
jgi:hypothetical protein